MLPSQSRSTRQYTFPPGSWPRERDVIGFFSDQIELTPNRMKLLIKLVGSDQWRRSVPSRRTTWEAVKAEVEKRRQSD